EIGAAWRNDSHLRIRITLLFLGKQEFRHRVLKGSCVAEPFGSPESRLHRPLVLVDGINARNQIADQKPCDKTNSRSQQDAHNSCSSRRKLHETQLDTRASALQFVAAFVGG